MSGDFEVLGTNNAAPFTLKLHRGDGMLLIAMNWREGRPPADFVGFGIQYREPTTADSKGDRFFDLPNRLSFDEAAPGAPAPILSSMRAPIQKFRWVHFPRNANLAGSFTYRVTPIFMNARDELSYGEAQQADIELRRDTYPGQLNIAFTRGFISSQAFVDRYEKHGDLKTLLPKKADLGLSFVPTHPDKAEAFEWMGFEARSAILELLDQALTDNAEVRVVAYDLNLPEIVSKLQAFGARLKIIIDKSGDHGHADSAETQAAAMLAASAGAANVKRQDLGGLQHNKFIIVDGPTVKRASCGSTNFSWRGFYVQSNNAALVTGAEAIKPFKAAFDAYWASDAASDFGATDAADWKPLGLAGVDAQITFSPHANANAKLKEIAADISANTNSSLFYSLAFLYQTEGEIKKSIKKISEDPSKFVYGISDHTVKGLDMTDPNGNPSAVYPIPVKKDAPFPFSEEPDDGQGVAMHHKFIVIDFNLPTARVYFGSYNFSAAADRKNGENLLLVRDRRVATSYMIEALRIFDHYHFRVARADAQEKGGALLLKKPPKAGEKAWFDAYYDDQLKRRDRLLFA